MKNAIVTGATRGIGLTIAEMLLKEKFAVTITYAHDEKAALACHERLSPISPNFEILRVNQADKAEMHAFALKMRKKEHIDCLVCNAGMTSRNQISDITEEEWECVMQVNVNSNVYLIRDLFDVIPNGSRIVFIGSVLGVFPHSVSLSYGVTKAAMHALALNLVKVFAGGGTTVNVIVPGFTETDWQKSKPLEIRNNICNKTAVKRFAKPEEIADAVKFCINNDFVNGSLIEVNGGYCYR